MILICNNMGRKYAKKADISETVREICMKRPNYFDITDNRATPKVVLLIKLIGNRTENINHFYESKFIMVYIMHS